MLSNKILYPTFFRTIPSDKNQVTAMIQLLVRFNWTWVALLGSDNSYGLEGMQSLSQQAPVHNICIAYQGVIPDYTHNTVVVMKNIVDSILMTKVTTIVVFSSKSKLSKFMPFVIERNVTEKVWIGTEDWSQSSLISGIPGIHTIGTVIGVAIKYTIIPGFKDSLIEASLQQSYKENTSKVSVNLNNTCLQSRHLHSLAEMHFPLDNYDIASAINVYKAVYAVAHAMHQLLTCDSGECQKKRVYPWEVSRYIYLTLNHLFVQLIFVCTSLLQLLSRLKQVQFLVANTSVYFDSNGDPPTGYDIISWVWRGMAWSVRVVGSFNPNPISLTIDADAVEWHISGNSRSVRGFGLRIWHTNRKKIQNCVLFRVLATETNLKKNHEFVCVCRCHSPSALHRVSPATRSC